MDKSNPMSVLPENKRPDGLSSAPTEITVGAEKFSPECLEQYKLAEGRVNERRIIEILSELVAIQSLPGEEKAIANYCTELLRQMGASAQYQPIDSMRGNAVARLEGDGSGPDLLLCAPLDFAFGQPEDEPWLGKAPRWDFSLETVVKDRQVAGLGAENPKAHAACILAAMEILASCDLTLRGDVIAGLVAGGMPVLRGDNAINDAQDIGFGVGTSYMLRSGVTADYAVLAKTGSAVTWEEAGLCWFRVDVFGTAFYSGTSNYTNFDNSIENAALILVDLQRLLKEYSVAHILGTVSPEANVTAIRGGWGNKGIIAPEVTQIFVDFRINPATSPQKARRQFASIIGELERLHPGVKMDWEMLVSCAAGRTDPANPIVQCAARAWEVVEGRPHRARQAFGGFTDFPILSAAMPTVRFGIDPGRAPTEEAPWTLGVAPIDGMIALTKKLLLTAISTCAQPQP